MEPHFSSLELLKKEEPFKKPFSTNMQRMVDASSKEEFEEAQRRFEKSVVTFLHSHGLVDKSRVSEITAVPVPGRLKVTEYTDENKFWDEDSGARPVVESGNYRITMKDGTKKTFTFDIAMTHHDADLLAHYQRLGPAGAHTLIAMQLQTVIAAKKTSKSKRQKRTGASQELVSAVLRKAPRYYIVRDPHEEKPLAVSISGGEPNYIRRVGNALGGRGNW